MYANQISQWPLMSSISYPIAISILYLLLLAYVKHIGNENHQDAWGQDALRNYMTFMAVLNWWLFFSLWSMDVKMGYSLVCEPVSKFNQKSSGKPFFSIRNWFWWWIWVSDSGSESFSRQKIAANELRIAKLMWIYLIAKFIEFGDQLLLAIQSRPISYADVAHHIVMVVISWIGLKNAPGGSSIIWATLNCAYLSFAFTYQATKRIFYIWDIGSDNFWESYKNVVKWMKLLHFTLVAFHAISILSTPYKRCNYPRKYATILLIFTIILIIINRPQAASPGPGSGAVDGSHSAQKKASRSNRMKYELEENIILDVPFPSDFQKRLSKFNWKLLDITSKEFSIPVYTDIPTNREELRTEGNDNLPQTIPFHHHRVEMPIPNILLYKIQSLVPYEPVPEPSNDDESDEDSEELIMKRFPW